MANHPEPNGPRVAHQSTYPGQFGVCLRTEISGGPGLRQIIADISMATLEDWALGFYQNIAGEFMASRVREVTVLNLCRE